MISISPDELRNLLSQPGWVVTGSRANKVFGSKPVLSFVIDGTILKLKTADFDHELSLRFLEASPDRIEILEPGVRRQRRKKHLWERLGEWKEIPTMDAVLKLHNPAVEAVEKDRQATDFRNREAHEQAEYNRTMQERRDVIAAKVTERLEGRAIVTAEGSGIRITFPDGFVLPILLEDNCESYSLHTTAMVFSADEQPFDYGDEPPSPKPSSMYF